MSGLSRRAFRILSVCLAVVLPCVAAPAAEPINRTIDQLQHTAWTAREGAPGPIFAIAQTTDGYLWLGTSAGLYRFDGIRFERYKPLSGKDLAAHDVSALLGTPDGGLWIGYRYGGGDFLKDGRIASHTSANGFPSGTVRRFVLDRDGTLWAAAYGQIGRFDGSHWQVIGKAWSYTWDSARDMVVDAAGTLWVANAETIAFLPRGARTFRHIAGQVSHPARLAQAPGGAGWVLQEPGADSNSTARPIVVSQDTRGTSFPEIGGLYSTWLFFDHAGNLWLTSVDGLLRVQSGALRSTEHTTSATIVVEKFTRDQGLTSDTQVCVFEDREHNVWVGTYSGLDRFRETNVVQAAPHFNTDTAFLLPGAHGDVWLAAREGREPVLLHMHGDAIEVRHDAHLTFGAVSRDARGVIWGGDLNGLWRFEDGTFQPVTAAGDAPKKRDVQAVIHDRSGKLWVSYVGAGIFLQSNNTWTHTGPLADLLHATAVSMLEDSSGRIWFGYLGNKLSVYDGTTVRSFTSAEGLPVTNIQVIHEHAGHIWVAGERGLALFKEKALGFQELVADGTLEFRGVSGLVETAVGDLWMNTIAGIIRIPASEVALAIGDPAHRVACETFDSSDGLLGKARQVRPVPTVFETADGLLWFLTTNGLVRIDPAHLTRNTIAPSVLVRSVGAEGRTYSSTDTILPVGTRNVHLDYTATSLSASEKVRFRYRLDGFDDAWQDAGTRREAFYTNLHPGNYAFRVIACNNDGVWNDTGASWKFAIAPAFYQTTSFQLLNVVSGVGVIWILYRLRVRTVAARIDLRYAERLAERTRIARELHDTLLQGVQGLILHFDAAMRHLNDPERTRPMMEAALDEAEVVLREGRERVRDLRSQPSETAWLEQELTSCGAELAKSAAVVFTLTVVGAPRPLSPAVGDEIYRVAREALANAFRHAHAAKVELELAYTHHALSVRVRDDGCGMGPEMVHQGRRGHWGLSGMRERAHNIQGQLRIWSHPGAGTEIELSVPGAVCYISKQ